MLSSVTFAVFLVSRSQQLGYVLQSAHVAKTKYPCVKIHLFSYRVEKITYGKSISGKDIFDEVRSEFV